MTSVDPRLARLRAQLLTEPEPDPDPGDDGDRDAVGVVRHLLAVQAQDPVGARLTVRARSRGLSASHVDRALDAGELVVSWLNRGTLHLVAAEDYGWLHALTTPGFTTSNLTRLRQEGVDLEQQERGVEVIEGELDGGPRTRGQLREALAAAGVPVAGQAVPHLLMRASILGICVRGPMAGAEQAFVSVDRWLGRQPPVDRAAAERELGGRYLAAHAPADQRDLAKWAGVGLGVAHRALADQGPAGCPDGGARVPRVRLLGPFDELLMGWASRDLVLEGHGDVVTRNGMFRPVVLVEGRAAGTWRRGGGEVTFDLFAGQEGALDGAAREVAAAEVADVRRFLST
jgi:winged helix DNA-binding protein